MASAVNKPTNLKEKDADVNRKLQIYGIISAFQNGKTPSNDQIDVALNSFLESSALSKPSDKLSDEGKKLVTDTREVVEQAKKLLLSKNEGNLIQDFIWQTTQFDKKSVQGPGAPVDKDTAKRDGQDALQGLRTLGTLLITNGQFRKLLKDFSVLARDMVGDGATEVANKARPSEEQLKDIDTAAPDNTWHDAPKMDKESLRSQAKNAVGGAKKDAKDVGDTAKDAAGSGSKSEDASAGKDAAKNKLKNKVDNKVDPETKEKMKQRNEEYRRKAKEYLDKKMPKERKDQLIWRLKKMILECQQHQDYTQAIQTLLRLAESYSEHTANASKSTAGSAKQARGGFAAAEASLRKLIERFANGTSTSNLWESIGQIYKDADKDPELKGWFKQMNAFIRRCLLEQGYILEDDSNHEWDRIYEKGRYLLREKYRTHTDRVIDETKFVGDQFDQDEQNKAFGQAVQKLFLDLGNDENGKSQFKPHLLKDLGEVILPAMLEKIAYIPIPRIEYSDKQFDAVIENLILESDNFMPNVVEVASDNYFRWGRKKIANQNKNTMDIKVAGIQMDLRDVSFHVKRKQGFPSIGDTGIVDLLLPGEGFSFRMKVSTAEKKDRQNFFKVDKVDVDLKGLDVKLKKSKFKMLFGLFKPVLLKALRPAMQKAVEKAIMDQCNKLDATLTDIKKEADRTGKIAKENGEKQGNSYKRFYNAAQKHALKAKEEKKKEAEKKTDDKKVNIAMTQEESLFPQLKLPGGISSKATEYKELARKGDKWESPVFSIGKAKKSTNIPTAPEVQRKSRNATNSAANAATNAATNGASAAVNGKASALPDGIPASAINTN